MQTVTYSSAHKYDVGDYIESIKPDYRWWMMLWHWLLRRPPPVIRQRFICTAVDSETTMQIDSAGSK